MTGEPRPRDGDRPHQNPVPAPSDLAALMAQIADIRAKVTELNALADRAGLHAAGDIRRRVTRLRADLGKLQDEVTAQGASLAKLLATSAQTQAPTWIGLSPDQHRAQLAELAQWVDSVLQPSYPASAPAPCWSHHWQAIWELSTLAAEWHRIYTQPTTDLAGALDWHDRWLPGVARRLAAIQADCTPTRCMAQQTQPAPG